MDNDLRDDAYRVLYDSSFKIPPVHQMLSDALDLIRVLQRNTISLKAMLENVEPPQHNSEWCGSNDCNACQFRAIATELEWPPWLDDFCPASKE